MCLLLRDREFFILEIERKEGEYHVVYADQRLVESCSKCLGSAGTNPETACHAYVACIQ